VPLDATLLEQHYTLSAPFIPAKPDPALTFANNLFFALLILQSS
jgi:hypothetical protein